MSWLTDLLSSVLKMISSSGPPPAGVPGMPATTEVPPMTNTPVPTHLTNPKLTELVGIEVANALLAAFDKWGIKTADEKAYFCAEAYYESGMFKPHRENLDYSAARMADVWPSRFAARDANGAYILNGKNHNPNVLALSLAHNPVKLGNNVYADRLGNGDAESGDGYNFRGGGWFQLTGQDNWQRCSKAMYGDDRLCKNTDLILEPSVAADSAGWYWQDRKINKDADAHNITKVTRDINGGEIGLDGRKHALALFQPIFGA